MRCTIPQISWHNRDPVLSVDIQPVENDNFYRLASGGADFHVLIWSLKIRENGALDVEAISDLDRHQRAVNVVRWSPSGQYLATGADDASIIIWNLKTDNIPLLEGETTDKETWIINKVLRGHREEIYDISWSPDGLKLISGSIDNTAILWDFNKGVNEQILSDHKGFVQGVTWDPKGQLIATLSSDRICRIFENTGKHVKSRIFKGLVSISDTHPLYNKELKYFHDDTFKSYFRRLTFSPDGNLLITPSGCIDVENYKITKNATYIFTLDCLKQPAAILPSPKQITIAVRCCPILFQLHGEGNDPLFVLPYRMIIAVATDSDILLYDTQQVSPFAHFQNVHYTRITDLTWSLDGRLLIASSSDGFCTLVTFESNELGIPYVKEDSDIEEMDTSVCEETEKTETKSKEMLEKELVESKVRKPNLLEQWTIRKCKDRPEHQTIPIHDTELASPLIQKASHSNITSLVKQEVKTVSNKKEVKRIIPTKIGEIKKHPTKINSIKNCETNNEKNSVGKSVNESIEKDNDSDGVIFIDDNSSENDHSNLYNSSSKKRKVATKTSKTNLLLKFFETSADEKKKIISKKINSATNKRKTAKKIFKQDENPVVIEIEDDSSLSATSNITDEEPNSQKLCNENITCKEEIESSSEQPTTCNNKIDKKSDSDGNIETVSIEKENMETDEVVINSGSNDVVEKSTNEQEVTKTVSSNLICSPIAKVPRRIPFITLSSPKRKK